MICDGQPGYELDDPRKKEGRMTYIIFIAIHQFVFEPVRCSTTALRRPILVTARPGTETHPDVAVDAENNVYSLWATWRWEGIEVGFQTPNEGCRDDGQLAVS